MKVPFAQVSLDVLDHVENLNTVGDLFIPRDEFIPGDVLIEETPEPSEIDSESQGTHIDVNDAIIPESPRRSEIDFEFRFTQNDGNDAIIPETSSEISNGDCSEDIFSGLIEIPSNNNVLVSKTSSEDEPNRVFDFSLEQFVIPESDESENSGENENIDALIPPSNNAIHETPENENVIDNAYVSETSSENASNTGTSVFEEIIMETDLSESDAEEDNVFDSSGAPSQNEPVCVPETDLSESDEGERSEIDCPVENEIIIPQTSSESEEDNYVPAVDDHLLTPTSVHVPTNQNAETSPDLFSEISEQSNRHEVAHDNGSGSQNSFVIAEEPMMTSISPNLFSDDNVSETFSIIAETESGSISPDIFDSEAFELPHDNHQDTDEMSVIHDESEEIAASEPVFLFIAPGKRIKILIEMIQTKINE